MIDNSLDNRFLQTLARGLDVLRAFRISDGPLGNGQIVERTGLPKSTVTRLTYTLSRFGFLEHIESLEKYRLGMAALELGNIAYVTLPFMDAANRVMQAFVDEVNLAVYLVSKKETSQMVIRHCWRPTTITASSSLWLDVGFPFPLHNSAAGLVYLAQADDNEAARLIEELTRLRTAESEDLSKLILDAKEQLSSRGFFTSLGGWNPSINGVGVPYRYQSFSTPLVFVVGANSNALSEDQIFKDIGPKMLQCVQQL